MNVSEKLPYNVQEFLRIFAIAVRKMGEKKVGIYSWLLVKERLYIVHYRSTDHSDERLTFFFVYAENSYVRFLEIRRFYDAHNVLFEKEFMSSHERLAALYEFLLNLKHES